jgi:hypothetical protein
MKAVPSDGVRNSRLTQFWSAELRAYVTLLTSGGELRHGWLIGAGLHVDEQIIEAEIPNPDPSSPGVSTGSISFLVIDQRPSPLFPDQHAFGFGPSVMGTVPVSGEVRAGIFSRAADRKNNRLGAINLPQEP